MKLSWLIVVTFALTSCSPAGNARIEKPKTLASLKIIGRSSPPEGIREAHTHQVSGDVEETTTVVSINSPRTTAKPPERVPPKQPKVDIVVKTAQVETASETTELIGETATSPEPETVKKPKHGNGTKMPTSDDFGMGRVQEFNGILRPNPHQHPWYQKNGLSRIIWHALHNRSYPLDPRFHVLHENDTVRHVFWNQKTLKNAAERRKMEFPRDDTRVTSHTGRNITHIRHKNVIIQNATLYHYISSPLRIERLVTVHTPINLTDLLQDPLGLVQTANTLQDACDAAHVHFAQLFPELWGEDARKTKNDLGPIYYYKEGGQTVWTRDKATAEAAGAVVDEFMNRRPSGTVQRKTVQNYEVHLRQERIEDPTLPGLPPPHLDYPDSGRTLPEYKGPRQDTSYVSPGVLNLTMSSDDQDLVFIASLTEHTIAEATLLCERLGTTLPNIDTLEQRYYLMRFLRKNAVAGVSSTFLNVEFDTRDARNKAMEGKLASQLSGNDVIGGAYCLQNENGNFYWSQRNCGQISNYDDDPNAVYLLYSDGLMRVVVEPMVLNGSDYEMLEQRYRLNRTMVEEKQVQRIKRPVVCQKSMAMQSANLLVNQTQKETRLVHQAFRDAIQLCYDTVEKIETEGVQTQLQLSDFWESHNIAFDSDIDPPPRRERRALLGAFTAFKAGFKILNKVRKFASGIQQYKNRHLFSKVLPEGRKSTQLLHLRSVAPLKMLPFALGVAGLGLGLWQNYQLKKDIREQRVILENHKSQLETHSRQIGTVQLAVDQNTLAIADLRREMETVCDLVMAAQTSIEVLTGIAHLNNAMMRAQQERSSRMVAHETRMREISEILVQAQAQQVPSLLTPLIKRKQQQRELAEDMLLPAAENTVEVYPVVKSSMLDIYTRFITGETRWELYDIYPLPRYAEGRMYYREAAFSHALVDDMQKHYVKLDDVTADRCRHGACPATGVSLRILDDKCTIVMIALEAPHDTCAIKDFPATPFFKMIDSTMVYSVPKNTKGRLHCPTDSIRAQFGVDREVYLKGIGVIDIPEGCTFELSEPEVSAIGPPLTMMIRDAEVKSLYADGSKLRTDQVVSGLSALRASNILASQYRETKQKVNYFVIVALTIGGTLGVAILILTGKAAWLYTRFRLVKDRLRTVTTGLGTTLQSNLMASSRLFRFITDRDRLVAFLEGGTTPRLQRHISMADLKTAKREQVPLHTLARSASDEDTYTSCSTSTPRSGQTMVQTHRTIQRQTITPAYGRKLRFMTSSGTSDLYGESSSGYYQMANRRSRRRKEDDLQQSREERGIELKAIVQQDSEVEAREAFLTGLASPARSAHGISPTAPPQRGTEFPPPPPPMPLLTSRSGNTSESASAPSSPLAGLRAFNDSMDAIRRARHQ